MSIHRLNHAVLYVRDLDETVAFYRDILGFREVMAIPARASFLQAPGSTNDHDLGLFAMGPGADDSPAGETAVGLYHLAWEVDTLGDLEDLMRRLAEAGALVGATNHGATKSLYAKDPNGIEFEVVWLVPAQRLTPEIKASAGIRPLDLQKEIDTFGRDTRGGLGISIPLGVEAPEPAGRPI
jgi:catechol-2,3-dioxygenase